MPVQTGRCDPTYRKESMHACRLVYNVDTPFELSGRQANPALKVSKHTHRGSSFGPSYSWIAMVWYLAHLNLDPSAIGLESFKFVQHRSSDSWSES